MKSKPRTTPGRERTSESIARELAALACTPRLAAFHGVTHEGLEAGWQELRAAVEREQEIDVSQEGQEPLVGQEAAFLLGVAIGRRQAAGGAR